MTVTDLDVVVRIVGALLLGGIVGFEREAEQKPAGLRTIMLVTLGSSLVMLLTQRIPLVIGDLALDDISMELDPTRILAAVVQGIGFLGAGTIFLHRRTVHGLTTAAAVWTMSVVGAAIGMGDWPLGIAGTLASFFILRILGPLSIRVEGRTKDEYCAAWEEEKAARKKDDKKR